MYNRAFVFFMCAVPVIAMFAPRVVGIAPPLIALVFFLGYKAAHGKWPIIPRAFLLWAAAFPALMALSALWSIEPAESLMRGVKTLPITLGGAILIALALKEDEDLQSKFRHYFPIAVFISVSVLAFDLYSHGAIYHLFHEPRADGRFSVSKLNRAAVVAALCFFPAMLCLLHGASPRGERLFRGAAIAIILALALWQTGSFAAQMALVAGALFFAVFPVRSKIAWPGIAGILIGLTFAAPWIAQIMFGMIAPMFAHTSFLSDAYVTLRMDIWDFVSRRALERPLTGFGADATEFIKNFDSSGLYWKSKQVLHPHNFAIQLWIEFGVMGPLLMGAFFMDFLQKLSRQNAMDSRIMGGLFIAVLLISASAFGFWQTYWIGLMGFVWAAAVLTRKNPR